MEKPVSGGMPLKTGRERKPEHGKSEDKSGSFSKSEDTGVVAGNRRLGNGSAGHPDLQANSQQASHLGRNSAPPKGGELTVGDQNDRKNKRRRRRKKRKSGLGHAPVLANGNNSKTFSEAGSPVDGAGLHSLPNEPIAAHQVESVAQKPRKNRRRRRRGGGRNMAGPEAARNLRAPVQHTPDVTFTGGQGSQKHEKRDQKTGRDDGPHSNAQGKQASRPVAWNETRYQKGTPLYAALDLGTNNCRLLVAAATSNGRFRVVDGYSRIVRLGEGLGQSGRLADDAMERAVGALKVCAAKLGNPDIRKVRLIATEACRRAENGEIFLARVLEETGLDLEIVDRETEARLAAEGCGALMDEAADGAVLFDIGGGSSELVLVDRNLSRSGAISQQIAAWTSLPLGVVTLAEQHGGKEVSRDVYSAMVAEVRSHIEAFDGRSRLADIWTSGRVHLLGTSGTVTTLAGVHLNLPRYDRRKVDGIWLQSRQIDTVIDGLLDMSFEERALSPCIGQERADLVLAGCAIFQAIREAWPAERLRVADRGLREGILTELMRADGAWQPRGRNSHRSGSRSDLGKGNGHNKKRRNWRNTNRNRPERNEGGQ